MQFVQLTRANHGTLNLVDADGDLIGTLTFWPSRSCSRELADAAVTMVQDTVNERMSDAVALGYPLQERSGPIDTYEEACWEARTGKSYAETGTITMRHENIDTHEREAERQHVNELLAEWPGGYGFADPGATKWLYAIAVGGVAATIAIVAYSLAG